MGSLVSCTNTICPREKFFKNTSRSPETKKTLQRGVLTFS